MRLPTAMRSIGFGILLGCVIGFLALATCGVVRAQTGGGACTNGGGNYNVCTPKDMDCLNLGKQCDTATTCTCTGMIACVCM